MSKGSYTLLLGCCDSLSGLQCCRYKEELSYFCNAQCQLLVAADSQLVLSSLDPFCRGPRRHRHLRPRGPRGSSGRRLFSFTIPAFAKSLSSPRPLVLQQIGLRRSVFLLQTGHFVILFSLLYKLSELKFRTTFEFVLDE